MHNARYLQWCGTINRDNAVSEKIECGCPRGMLLDHAYVGGKPTGVESDHAYVGGKPTGVESDHAYVGGKPTGILLDHAYVGGKPTGVESDRLLNQNHSNPNPHT